MSSGGGLFVGEQNWTYYTTAAGISVVCLEGATEGSVA